MEWTDPENISRKLLTIEVEETEELKQQRLNAAAKEETLKNEIKEITKVCIFYCFLYVKKDKNNKLNVLFCVNIVFLL